MDKAIDKRYEIRQLHDKISQNYGQNCVIEQSGRIARKSARAGDVLFARQRFTGGEHHVFAVETRVVFRRFIGNNVYRATR
ncbi:MAG TPA: hypothetical protein PLK80_10960 [bacterium]|nr:hypothetical protein [bacterium]HPI77241.1 hypothetical protein [bacterium]